MYYNTGLILGQMCGTAIGILAILSPIAWIAYKLFVNAEKKYYKEKYHNYK